MSKKVVHSYVYDEIESLNDIGCLTDSARNKISSLIKTSGDSPAYYPFFYMALKKFILVDKIYDYKKLKTLITRYAIVFAYFNYRTSIGISDDLEKLIRKDSIKVLDFEKELRDGSVLANIYNTCIYNGEFSHNLDTAFVVTNKILNNCYDFFSSTYSISSLISNENKKSFDVLVCDAINDEDIINKKINTFEIIFEDESIVKDYIDGKDFKPNIQQIAHILNNAINCKTLSLNSNGVPGQSDSYYRIVDNNIKGNHNRYSLIKFLEYSKDNLVKIHFDKIDKPIIFTHNNKRYSLSNTGLVQE